MSNAYMVQVVVVLHTLKTMSSFSYGKNEICCTSLASGPYGGIVSGNGAALLFMPETYRLLFKYLI
jgi:hypothetical protein